eukprot:3940977-Pyramimonas_sp.AAC.1
MHASHSNFNVLVAAGKSLFDVPCWDGGVARARPPGPPLRSRAKRQWISTMVSQAFFKGT